MKKSSGNVAKAAHELPPVASRARRNYANAADSALHHSAEKGVHVVADASSTRHATIARAAYYRAEQRGFAPGHELDDWLAAETEVARALGSGAS
jgi:hypothetical protein